MTVLITVFYAMLLTVTEPVATDCEQKLAQLNYIYEYNEEPAICPDDFYDAKTKRCYNEVDTNTFNAIQSIYDCFKELESAKPNKVILISYQSILNPAQMKGAPKSKIETSNARKRKIMQEYGLMQNNVYFKSVPKQSSFAKIELIDKNDQRIKNIPNSKPGRTIILRCTECPS